MASSGKQKLENENYVLRKTLLEARQVINKMGLDLKHIFNSVYCELHNSGNTLLGNTPESDLVWFARNLWEASGSLGMADINTADWCIDNETFESLGLRPNRKWSAGAMRFEDMPEPDQQQWINLARACLLVMPKLCQRIGHRMQEYSKAMDGVNRAEWVVLHSKKEQRSDEQGQD